MSKSLQWVIGIGVVLLVAAVILADLAPYVLPRLGLAVAPQFGSPEGIYGRHMPFQPGFMFGLGGRMPFMGFFGLARCVWPLLLAGLIVLAISVFGRRPGPYAAQPPLAAAMPVTPPAQAPMAQPPLAAISQTVCPNCGQPLQAVWRHCPNCGTPVAQ